MVVMILERVTPGLRGELTRWLIQPKAGVFVGKISALVRDKLWTKVRRSLKQGGAIMIYNSDTEQGFAVQAAGETDRSIQDFEGILLARTARRG